MTMKKILPGLSILFAVLLPVAAASAAETLILKTDQTQVMMLNKVPGTVVIGNPSIADLTIEGKQLFLHGRGFGTTNIIIFDQAGKEAYNYEVTVMNGASNDVAMYKAGSMFTYVCAPDCEGAMHVGDNPAWFGLMLGQTGTKAGFATGKTASDGGGGGTAPPAQ